MRGVPRPPRTTPRLRPRGAPGFTLLEVLLASVIFVVVMAAIYTSYAGNQALFSRGERMTDLQQNARAALDILTRELRLAGYTDTAAGPDPNNPPPNPRRDPNPILIARRDILVTRGDVTVNRQPQDFFYGVQTGQTAVCPTPPCLLRGLLTPGVSTYSLEGAGGTWQVVSFNIQALNFEYFDANNNDITPGAPPAALDGVNVGAPSNTFVAPIANYTQRALVRRVVVTITARDNQGAKPYQGSVPTYTLWTDVNIRNLEGVTP